MNDLLNFLKRCAIGAASVILTQTGYAWSSDASHTDRDVVALATAIEVYHNEYGKYPEPDTYWVELQRVGMREPTESSRPIDRWGHPIVYRLPGKHGVFDVYSYGKDGVDNDGQFDDISSWSGVNDGFYWKKTWPRGRFTIVMGMVLGFACMLFVRAYSWTVITPIAGIIICISLILGNYWLMHPGVVPSHNVPLELTALIAYMVLTGCATILLEKFRRRRRVLLLSLSQYST